MKPVFNMGDHPDIGNFMTAANTGRRQEMHGFDADYFVRRAFHEIWNWRLLNKVEKYY